MCLSFCRIESVLVLVYKTFCVSVYVFQMVMQIKLVVVVVVVVVVMSYQSLWLHCFIRGF